MPGDHAYMLYNTGGIWTETVTKALMAGDSFDERHGPPSAASWSTRPSRWATRSRPLSDAAAGCAADRGAPRSAALQFRRHHASKRSHDERSTRRPSERLAVTTAAGELAGSTPAPTPGPVGPSAARRGSRRLGPAEPVRDPAVWSPAIIPIGYAVVIALQTPATPLNPAVGFGGAQSFITVVTDFRFLRTFGNIFAVLIVWLPVMMLGIVGLALLIHASPGRFGDSMRFIYYLPGALAGVANFVLWVYLLNPAQSPIGARLNAFDLTTIKEVIASDPTCR